MYLYIKQGKNQVSQTKRIQNPPKTPAWNSDHWHGWVWSPNFSLDYFLLTRIYKVEMGSD